MLHGGQKRWQFNRFRSCLTFQWLDLQRNPRIHVHDAERELHQAGHCGSHVLPFLVPQSWVTCEQIFECSELRRRKKGSQAFWHFCQSGVLAGANYVLPKLSDCLRFLDAHRSCFCICCPWGSCGKTWKMSQLTWIVEQTKLHCKHTRLSFFNIWIGVINAQPSTNKSHKNILEHVTVTK